MPFTDLNAKLRQYHDNSVNFLSGLKGLYLLRASHLSKLVL